MSGLRSILRDTLSSYLLKKDIIIHLSVCKSQKSAKHVYFFTNKIRKEEEGQEKKRKKEKVRNEKN